jgi:hypothetical protein
MTTEGPFSRSERQTLHSLAEMFQDKEDRDELRRILEEGTTIRELVMAFKTNRRVIGSLKAVAGLIVVLGGAIAALKGLNWWPK